jgi:hypothetical protein
MEVDARSPIKEARVDKKLLPAPDLDYSGHDVPLSVVNINYEKST